MVDIEKQIQINGLVGEKVNPDDAWLPNGP